MSQFSLFTQSDSDSTLSQRVIPILVKVVLSVLMLLTAFWAGLIFWVHLNDHPILRGLAVAMWASISTVTLYFVISQHRLWQRWLAGYGIFWLLVAAWFAWLPAKQDRPWMAEVSQILSYQQDAEDPNLVTIYNVRDFDWVRKSDAQELIQPTQPYYYKAVDKGGQDVVLNERWRERTVDISKLSGIDIINSYWMGEQIAHTLLSFRFEDDRPLSFSIEIRKEQDESFSVFGGFVKQFEMAVVASEERDIVYTRSNVRGEQVYMFPLQGLSREQVQALFWAYLQQGEALQQEAKWYNTLLRNCTTVIFDMLRQIDDKVFPWDYRVLMSGYVPNYLYDQGVLPDQADWDISQWYVKAHINPKVADFSYEDNQDLEAFSKQIREGLPRPSLNQITH
ncbi:Lnb N-terminal periplasmic domain-containing protein [Psychrobacter lutiphocae]|uniref:Lnb N-terminal periplasmic domain-containing protein n=1 Tax=Psychrobacter lutiphocae TaxID=540500 RepID=UPI000373B6B7|nr:DUF4105 domain-containing protein [Psychrobacter lutiphocae]